MIRLRNIFVRKSTLRISNFATAKNTGFTPGINSSGTGRFDQLNLKNTSDDKNSASKTTVFVQDDNAQYLNSRGKTNVGSKGQGSPVYKDSNQKSAQTKDSPEDLRMTEGTSANSSNRIYNTGFYDQGIGQGGQEDQVYQQMDSLNTQNTQASEYGFINEGKSEFDVAQTGFGNSVDQIGDIDSPNVDPNFQQNTG